MTTYTIEGLVDQIEKTGRSYNIPLIRSAYETAAQLHEGQKRSSGEPYIIHPVAVASILVELGMEDVYKRQLLIANRTPAASVGPVRW